MITRYGWLFAVLTVACGVEPKMPTPPPDPHAAFRSLRYAPQAPAADVSNRYADDPKAARLGQRLYFDPSLSGPLVDPDNGTLAGTLGNHGQPGRVSCAGCHVPTSGFVDTRSPGEQISLASEWSARKTPMLLESGFVSLFNWDGVRDSMWRQAIGVMESEREFNSGRLFIAEQIFQTYRADYEAIFGAMPPLDDTSRFPTVSAANAGCVPVASATTLQYVCHGKPGDGAEYDGMATADQTAVTRVLVNVGKAVSAYVRQLRCGESRFDAWLDGDDTALSEAEQRGAALFVGQASCVTCHSGPNLTDNKFHNVGLAPSHVAAAFIDQGDRGAIVGVAAALTDPLNTRGPFSDGDDGRLPAAVDPSMESAFRTPSLRCAGTHPSFMHTGQLRTMDDAIAFFDRGGDPPGAYSGHSELAPLGLSAPDRADLTAFCMALQGAGPDAALLAPP
jgi:cytochrome c peroxidase